MIVGELRHGQLIIIDRIRETVRRDTNNRVSCQTANEFADRAQQYPEVRGAAAESCWTGAWWTTSIIVHRAHGRAVDEPFRRGR